MSESPAKDVVQVGLPESIDAKLKQLHRETTWFAKEEDIYRVAVALALARDWRKPDWRKRKFEGGKDSKYRAILLDEKGQMKELISLLAPECGNSPYRYSQWLAVAGINYLHQKLLEEDEGIDEALGLREESESDV